MSDPVLGLLGSGEFEGWAGEVDRALLQRARVGEGRALVLPTACAPEGEDAWERWATRGLRHYASMEVPAEVVPLRIRSDASDPEIVGRLEDASLVFFSGGNPAYLAATLHGTPFWTRLLELLREGLAYGGCSAGIAALGDVAIDSSEGDPSSPQLWKPGLGLFPGVRLAPHWDALEGYRPGLQEALAASVTPDERMLAVDERTALLGDGAEWRVLGRGSVHLLEAGAWRSVAAGGSLSARLVT